MNELHPPATAASAEAADPDYALLARELDALLAGETDRTANAANTAALIFQRLPRVSWAGFYFTREAPGAGDGAQLVLGPFQGKPACVRIDWGRGVCGTAASTRRTQRVADVHAFEGHIACDPDSRSELVVPLVDAADRVVGVLDLDSTDPARFAAADEAGVAALASVFMQHWARGA